ncbi:hypothetical protein JCM4914_09250 [Streptomyces platensis subsp. malvinus]
MNRTPLHGALSAAFVGGSFTANSLLGDYPWAGGQALRYGLAALILLALVGRRAGPPLRALTRRQWGRLALLAALGMLGFNLAILAAERTAEPAVPGVFVGCAPVVVALLVPALAGRRPSPAVVRGALLVAAGAWVVQGWGRTDAMGLVWSLAALCGEVGFAVLAVPVLPSLGPRLLSAVVSALAAVEATVVGTVTGGAHWLRMPDAVEAAALGWQAVVVTVVGFVCWYAGIQRIGAERATLFSGLIPVFAALTAPLAGTGGYGPAQLGGSLLVGAGVGLGAGVRPGPARRGSGVPRTAPFPLDNGRTARWDGRVRSDTVTDVFEEHRPVLFGVAYRMLGRVADAEDVVQDAWLRWAGADRAEVREPRAFLVRITTRLAIDRLRQVQSRRESYVGPWLPEPLATDAAGSPPDGAERAVFAETVTLAVLVVMESLSPLERAVFVLREAFGYPYAEIATALDRSEAAVRQLAGRARRHVEEGSPRYEVDPERQRDLTERFLAAAAGDDLEGLLSLLAADARLVGDSGGKAKAPLRIIESADKVARFLLGVAKSQPAGLDFRLCDLNGRIAVLLHLDGVPDTVVQLGIQDGRIRTVYLVRNPDKLGALAAG